MAVEIRGMPVAASAPHVPVGSRLYGLGSVFGKTLRDARLGVLVVGGAPRRDDAGRRHARWRRRTARPRRGSSSAAMSGDMPPMLRGMYGNPGQRRHARRVHLVALRSLLRAPRRALVHPRPVVHPRRRGAPGQPRLRRRDASLAAPDRPREGRRTRRRRSASPWPSWRSSPGRPAPSFATLPGDAISPLAAISFAIGLGIRALIAGSIAFALAPVPRARRRRRHRRRADARRLRRPQLPDRRAGVRHARRRDLVLVDRRITCRSPGSPTGRRSPSPPSPAWSCSRSASRRSRGGTSG